MSPHLFDPEFSDLPQLWQVPPHMYEVRSVRFNDAASSDDVFSLMDVGANG